MLNGFPHDPRIHQHKLFGTSSLNTYGYSPHPLQYYLTSIKHIVENSQQKQTKPFIVSITGSASEVAECVLDITEFAQQENLELWVEINLSCPNIPEKPPPAYDEKTLKEYLELLPDVFGLPVGLKTPPYTYAGQFEALFGALKSYPGKISFITTTNTLGSSLHLSSPPSLSADQKKRIYQPTLSSAAGTGVGGLAGESIHWISLGNVDTIRRWLNKEGLQEVVVIGVGGVSDKEAMLRMLAVGAGAVEVGTALGREGVEIFQNILEEKTPLKK